MGIAGCMEAKVLDPKLLKGSSDPGERTSSMANTQQRPRKSSDYFANYCGIVSIC
jgi:hypothetical protein